MPKKAKELLPVQIKRLTQPGFYAVGGVAGLHLQVKDSGARSWILRVKIGSRRRDLGLGGYPDVKLAAARDSAREAREQIRQGIDPVEARKAARAALMAAQAKELTFEQAAVLCHKSKAPAFRNIKHGSDWINSIQRYAVPIIGKLPVADVELPHVIKILEPIWTTKTETATRVRQRIESVLAWAAVSGYRTGDNPARWKGNLEYALAKPSKVRTVQHQHDILDFAAAVRPDHLDRTLRGRQARGQRVIAWCRRWPRHTDGLQLGDVLFDRFLIASRPAGDNQLGDRHRFGPVRIAVQKLERYCSSAWHVPVALVIPSFVIASFRRQLHFSSPPHRCDH